MRTDKKSIGRFNSEVESCKQALTDYAEEMDLIAEDLAQYGSFRIQLNKHYTGERFASGSRYTPMNGMNISTRKS